MGDYNTYIYTGAVKKLTDSELDMFREEVVKRLPNHLSAYHSVASTIDYDNSWDHETRFTFVTQAKVGIGTELISKFEEWLGPQVVDGVGQSGAWAMSFTESCNLPMVQFSKTWEEC